MKGKSQGNTHRVVVRLRSRMGIRDQMEPEREICMKGKSQGNTTGW